MVDILKIILSRVIASLVAGFLTWLGVRYGIIFDDNEKAQIVAGIVSLSLTIFMIIYAIVHKWIDRHINPGDAASKKLLRQETTEQRQYDNSAS